MSNRGFTLTAARRAERRKQAEERQKLYDALTLQQKLDKLPFNGAKRQRAKLVANANKRITDAGAPYPPPDAAPTIQSPQQKQDGEYRDMKRARAANEELNRKS